MSPERGEMIKRQMLAVVCAIKVTDLLSLARPARVAVRYLATRHGAPLAFAIVVLTVGACSSIQRVPKTAARPKSAPFTSRDGPPTSFINSTADARTTRVIVLRDGLSNEVLFRIATDYL